MVVYWFNLLVLLWAVILQYSISFTVPHSYRLALTKSSAYKYSNFCSRLRSIRKQSGELSARTQGNEDNPTPIYYLPNSPISIDSVVGYVQQWARENQEAMTEIQDVKDGVKIYFTGTNGSHIHFFASHKNFKDRRFQTDSNNDITLESRLNFADRTKTKVNSLLRLIYDNLVDRLSNEIADIIIGGIQNENEEIEDEVVEEEVYDDEDESQSNSEPLIKESWASERQQNKRYEDELVQILHDDISDFIADEDEETVDPKYKLIDDPFVEEIPTKIREDEPTLPENSKEFLVGTMDMSPMVVQQHLVVDAIHKWSEKFVKFDGAGLECRKIHNGIEITFLIEKDLKLVIATNDTLQPTETAIPILLRVDVLVIDTNYSRVLDLRKDVNDTTIDPKLRLIKIAASNMINSLGESLSKLLELSFYKAGGAKNETSSLTSDGSDDSSLNHAKSNDDFIDEVNEIDDDDDNEDQYDEYESESILNQQFDEFDSKDDELDFNEMPRILNSNVNIENKATAIDVQIEDSSNTTFDNLLSISKSQALEESVKVVQPSVDAFTKAKKKKESTPGYSKQVKSIQEQQRENAANELRKMIENSKNKGFTSVLSTPEAAKDLLVEVNANSQPPEEYSNNTNYQRELASLFLRGEEISKYRLETLLDRTNPDFYAQNEEELKNPSAEFPTFIPKQTSSSDALMSLIKEISDEDNENNIPEQQIHRPKFKTHQQIVLEESVDELLREKSIDGDHSEAMREILTVDKATIKQDQFRLQLLFTDLKRALGSTDLENLVLDAFKDFYLSQNFLPLMKYMNATESDPERRLIYKKINDKGLEVNLEVVQLMNKESCRHLATIQELCRITTLLSSNNEEDVRRYYEEMDNMRNYIDTELCSFLDYAIEQEEITLRKKGQTASPSAWLQILRIIRKGVLAEFESRYEALFEGLFYVLRFHDYPDLQETVFEYYINETAAFELGYMKVLATNMVEHFLESPSYDTKMLIKSSLKELPSSSASGGKLIEGDLIEKMKRLKVLVDKFLPDEMIEQKMEEVKRRLAEDGEEIVFKFRDPRRQEEYEMIRDFEKRRHVSSSLIAEKKESLF